MGYGISILGQNSSYQIDSDNTQTIYLSVISSGQVAGTNNSRATVPTTSGDIVWMNAAEVASGGQYQLRNGPDTTAATTNYIVTRKTNTLSAFSGTYGLQIWNSASPSVKIFDSRGITEGVLVFLVTI